METRVESPARLPGELSIILRKWAMVFSLPQPSHQAKTHPHEGPLPGRERPFVTCPLSSSRFVGIITEPGVVDSILRCLDQRDGKPGRDPPTAARPSPSEPLPSERDWRPAKGAPSRAPLHCLATPVALPGAFLECVPPSGDVVPQLPYSHRHRGALRDGHSPSNEPDC